jgi:hypothetical protein
LVFLDRRLPISLAVASSPLNVSSLKEENHVTDRRLAVWVSSWAVGPGLEFGHFEVRLGMETNPGFNSRSGLSQSLRHRISVA